MPTEHEAVSLLLDLGLSEYEARCFVGLSRVQRATAKEIADLSEVPRSRVYDTVEELHERGLVEIQQSDPREYQAIPADAALTILRDQYTATLEAAGEALDGLRQRGAADESGAWAIANRQHITNRIELLLSDATTEVYMLIADDAVAEGPVIDHLADLADDITVVVEVPTEEAEESITAALPDATVVVTDLAGSPAELEGKRLGRIILVDRQSLLVSALTESTRPGQPTETAIWARGPDHGLVVGFRHLLGARADDPAIFGGDDPVA